MKQKRLKRLAVHTALILAVTLCSCALEDPMYSQNAARIPNVDFPRDKIAGTWASMGMNAFVTPEIARESKIYYEIRPNGTGTVRQFSLNRPDGHFLTIEAEFTWRYLGKNTWTVRLPASTEYRVISSSQMTMGSRGPVAVTVRYYNGNIYMPQGKEVWVPADREHVSQLANRLRSQPRVMLNLQQ
jgi:hypothetical protein